MSTPMRAPASRPATAGAAEVFEVRLDEITRFDPSLRAGADLPRRIGHDRFDGALVALAELLALAGRTP
jgi:hypothetical protein